MWLRVQFLLSNASVILYNKFTLLILEWFYLKKKNFFRLYDIIFIISVIAVFIYAVFRIACPFDCRPRWFWKSYASVRTWFSVRLLFYDYAVRFLIWNLRQSTCCYMCQDFCFSADYDVYIPTATARLICLPFGAFDMRILAGIMFLWYATVCFFIQRKFKIENKFLHCIFLLFFIVVFFNGINLTILNSLYGQSVMLVSFATVVLFGLYMFENVHDAKNSVIIFFTVSSCLLLGSKLQCAVFTPFLIIAVLYVGFKSNKRNLCIVCSIVFTLARSRRIRYKRRSA